MAEAAELGDRLIGAAIGALELQSIYVGRRLGLYEQLRSARSVDDLADAAGIHPRYAREWLEQQAVAGLVSVDDGGRFFLDDAQQAVLAEPLDPYHVAPLADMVAGGGQVMDRVVDAYRTGGGVPYADYGQAFRDGQGGINRPAFHHDLATWVAEAPGVADRLRAGGRVADLGCGTGWSTISMAKAFPDAEVVGYDADAASIADAVGNAAGAGVAVEFRAVDAAEMGDEGPFDLVLLLEVLHDLAHPVELLGHARRALGDGGAVLVADEKVADRFRPDGDELERMMYGWSVGYCLPASMAEEGSAALGTVLRESTVRDLAGEAGFGMVTVSDLDAGFFRLYVLTA
jgi:2-polyprenyl-3-methyl-5-hydroxy-6-metoxy-1,4-benzoquinol methylase